VAFALVAGVVAIMVGWWHSNSGRPIVENVRRAKTIFIGAIIVVGAIAALSEYVQSIEWTCLFLDCG